MLPGLLFVVCGVRTKDLIRYQKPRPGSLEILVAAPTVSVITFCLLFFFIYLNDFFVGRVGAFIEGAKADPAKLIFDKDYAKTLSEYQLFWILLVYLFTLAAVCLFSIVESKTKYKSWRYRENKAPWFIKLVKEAEGTPEKSICAEVSLKTQTDSMLVYYGALQYAELDQNDNILNVKLEASARVINQRVATGEYYETVLWEQLDGISTFSKDEIRKVQLYIRDKSKDEHLGPANFDYEASDSSIREFSSKLAAVSPDDENLSSKSGQSVKEEFPSSAEIFPDYKTIDETQLDGAILKYLKSEGITRLKDLMPMTHSRLLLINGIGPKRAEKVLAEIKKYRL